MKLRLGVLAWLLSLPLTAHGHTEIFFPRLFSTAELPNTGFVLLNPDPIPSTVGLCLFKSSGLPTASDKCPAGHSASLTIPAGGQVSKLGSELFPNATSGGWVYLINDTEGMQAFWLTYNSGLTQLDGAEAAGYDTIGPDQIIPLVAGETELNIVNPGFSRFLVTIRIFGETGELAAAITRDLPIAGAFQSQVATLFPAVDMTRVRFIRVQTAGAQIAASAVIRGFLVANESGVINGVNVALRTDLTFPHVVHGLLTGANYTTLIGVTNLSTARQTIRLTFNPDGGTPLEASRTIEGNGALRETVQSLFNLGSGFRSGWVSVTGTTALTGFAAYADSIAGGFAIVPPGIAQSKLFFSHIADGPPQWQTGIALLNATDTAAAIDIFAMNPSGTLIGKTTINLEPRSKTARALRELIPQARGINGGFVFVRTANNLPLFAIELFYTEDLKVLSNVAAGKLVSGVTYAPPPL